ncbi:hypothetical protein AB0G74_30125 [Streptomyces sp. NPDC020875]|uniref:hypothetical protein n=1 Tax=Streptomyces sp. NPDC020875 TaxID=3154898 RepID=UPI0033DC5FC0
MRWWNTSAQWVTGIRLGNIEGQPVAVNEPWLARLPDGYRLEGSPGHPALRIISPANPGTVRTSGPGASPGTVVGVTVPLTMYSVRT